MWVSRVAVGGRRAAGTLGAASQMYGGISTSGRLSEVDHRQVQLVDLDVVVAGVGDAPGSHAPDTRHAFAGIRHRGPQKVDLQLDAAFEAQGRDVVQPLEGTAGTGPGAPAAR